MKAGLLCRSKGNPENIKEHLQYSVGPLIYSSRKEPGQTINHRISATCLVSQQTSQSKMVGTTAPVAPPLQNQNAQSNGINSAAHVPSRVYSLSHPPSLASFETLCAQSANPDLYPQATSIVSNIPIYDLSSLPHTPNTARLQDEWHHILLSGPGVFVLRNFFTDTALLQHINTVFDAIIASESSYEKGDHFAAFSKNGRIWNSFQKHAERDPASFVRYYANPWLAHVCEAWLGPAYQVTTQVNIVKPGGKPQVTHRDYHLGFQTAEACSKFPKAMQIASQLLTLQGAVAHSDMPLESGPTRFLPFSQQFEEGFMAYRVKEFQEYFDRNWVSVELKMGDAVFFNPALFHAAGENRTTDVDRSANLLQVSSAMGRTMESIETLSIISKCWDEVRRLHAAAGMTSEVRAILSAVGEGYPFPTNLDRRPPAPGGMAPESEIDILQKALEQGWSREEVLLSIKTIRKDAMP
ncbi:hypothetical protein LTS13_001311 [Exophiala xenobiotica]|nr:hypothetical protein LTS13_001311 [Exophiala xenobiotica]KAK5398464.1 hypothetical protein LTR79_004746 [Exophiala xenobiotica]KAK5480685.1 hypothetical protein LTR55_007188 [Exophiala xenobiotica]KAK5524104.1 hypothetical protein LTR07_003776 [Exophiala xenobiotica]